jgi:hypothetical protein
MRTHKIKLLAFFNIIVLHTNSMKIEYDDIYDSTQISKQIQELEIKTLNQELEILNNKLEKDKIILSQQLNNLETQDETLRLSELNEELQKIKNKDKELKKEFDKQLEKLAIEHKILNEKIEKNNNELNKEIIKLEEIKINSPPKLNESDETEASCQLI